VDVSDVTQTEDVMRAAVMAVSQEESILPPCEDTEEAKFV